MRAPSRDAVATWWRDLLDGRCSLAETHERVRPWVEEDLETIDDPITAMGVQHLYGCSLSGDDGVDRHRDPEARALFERWLADGARFDADPDCRHRDRLTQAVHAVRREQGPDRARALAIQLVAQGSLSSEDVTQILGTYP